MISSISIRHFWHGGRPVLDQNFNHSKAKSTEYRRHIARVHCHRASLSEEIVFDRRKLIQLVACGQVLLSIPAWAAEDKAEPIQQQVTVPVKPKLYIARDFLFQYPPGWRVLEDQENGDVSADRRKQNVVRAEVVSPDQSITISVIQQQAAKIKQSLFQITDIQQLGSIDEVARFILPPGTKILDSSVRKFELPSKNTGTVIGVIEREPVSIYRYSASLSNGARSEIAAGIILGRVLLLGVGCQETVLDPQKEETLKAIADSFKLLPK